MVVAGKLFAVCSHCRAVARRANRLAKALSLEKAKLAIVSMLSPLGEDGLLRRLAEVNALKRLERLQTESEE
jgi:hypothetical protein